MISPGVSACSMTHIPIYGKLSSGAIIEKVKRYRVINELTINDMKKYFVFAMMLIVGFCMSACSSDNDDRLNDNSDVEVAKETYPFELQTLTKEEFHALFQRAGMWSDQIIYNVSADGTMSHIDDVSDAGFCFSVTGESTIEEYLLVLPREIYRHTGNYVFHPETNKVSFTNMNEDFNPGAFLNDDYVVVSLTEDELRLLSDKRFSKFSPQEAVYTLYVFRFSESQGG